MSDFSSRMEAAAELGRRAAAGGDPDMLARLAVHIAADGLQAEFSSLLELQADGQAVFRAGVGWHPGTVGITASEMSGESVAGYVIRTERPLAIGDLRHDGRFVISSLLQSHGVVSSLIVPLVGQHRPLGVLGVHGQRPREFSREDIAWLEVLGSLLAGSVERRTRAVAENDQKLLRAEQMMALGQVAAGVAHELRNPLTSIKGLVQVNERDLEDRGMPVEDLAVIEHEIRRMERTLQTFLDFARPPKPDRRRADIAEIINRVLSLAGGRARKQQVALHLLHPDAPVLAEVDEDQIQQLLLNLVLNALDAMPQGGHVEIELRQPQDGLLEILIRDTGPGIAPQILPKVFETFVSSKETGVGLGLPLSRRIAEDHGGSLAAYNLPLAGACFVLRLPAG
jgi:signal transduction histidine kinase